MAMAKTLELKTKLLGFHKEKVEISNAGSINFLAVIEAAKARVSTRVVHAVSLPIETRLQQTPHPHDADPFGD